MLEYLFLVKQYGFLSPWNPDKLIQSFIKLHDLSEIEGFFLKKDAQRYINGDSHILKDTLSMITNLKKKQQKTCARVVADYYTIQRCACWEDGPTFSYKRQREQEKNHHVIW